MFMYTKTCTQMFIIPLFLMANLKRSKYPSTVEWTNKGWNNHEMEYYSAIKNKLLIHTISWIDFKIVIVVGEKVHTMILHIKV